MGKRRFAQVATSDDEEEPAKEAEKKRLKAEAGGNGEEAAKEGKGGRRAKAVEEEEEGEDEEDEDEEEDAPQEDAKPVGEVVRVSGKGRKRKRHYAAFEYDGNHFELEDSVLLTPEESSHPQKPYVAIIKDITQDTDGNMMVNGQWFYRPEEAEKKGGGSWQARDTRELFYSFHLDEVPAESVMHKCVVHFVPLNKQLPVRSEHPGFIVQRVYDTVERKLWKLTDKDYEDDKQHEIDLLVQKTQERIGELPDIGPEETCPELEDPIKTKRPLRRKNMLPIDVARNDEVFSKLDAKAETPGSCTSEASEYYNILANAKALTGHTYRDKWLEKLLQGIQNVCVTKDSGSVEDKAASSGLTEKSSENGKASQDKSSPISKLAGKTFSWPDDAIPAITALEKAADVSLASDFQKYNQKMRQLDFNLKNNRLLAKRLLNKELEPSVILNMSPAELKDGLTSEEKTTQEPERSERMQMTDARCSRCHERKVGVADIIQAGGHGDRYQLECIACGYMWYAPRDAISSLTIDTPKVAGNVGTAPWATAKFEDVEKKLVSPRDSEKPSTDVFHKSTAAYMPVLEPQKSFNRGKAEDVPSAD